MFPHKCRLTEKFGRDGCHVTNMYTYYATIKESKIKTPEVVVCLCHIAVM